MLTTAELFSLLIPALLEGVETGGDEVARGADNFFEVLSGSAPGETLTEPFLTLVDCIEDEFLQLQEGSVSRDIEELVRFLGSGASIKERPGLLWKVFFPEALYLDDDPRAQIDKLRKRRRIKILRPAEVPITRPEREMLFTSNVLLTVPVPGKDPLPADNSLRKKALDAAKGPQQYWYDHPVPLGTSPESNEVLYGLKGLARAYGVEKERRPGADASHVKVLLSISVTHRDLRPLAGEWLSSVLSGEEKKSLEGLEVFGFTEDDTAEILNILDPCIDGDEERLLLREVFGVDGEYGRHYSFLKAFPALWSVLLDPDIRGTFKIDLDQVFPQQELIAETGKSAFELFTSPLWGAYGRDFQGKECELGMIAGALVNEGDIRRGLFTPDIPWPESTPTGEDLFFFKQRPMAVSTRAEMMTRYGEEGMPDGTDSAIERFHVTGGTNGILLESLRRHRPFTPGFVGRAEDQAYILSTFTAEGPPRLGYLHQPGLIMRHDKEAFASQAVTAGKAGSYVGDLVRTLVFSDYASFLQGGQKMTKAMVDPFTGCFISAAPAISAGLRLALHLVDTSKGSPGARKEVLELAARRLPEILKRKRGPRGELARRWQRERRAWNLYYDLLDRLEEAPPEGVRAAFSRLVERCRLV
ncbi:hypothetical protein [Marispirochaeta aestuarii]|uniref:hypothetical protein n=1 Tax=Marispirochaeta aestuarii TaxID=1963862 RepID=UPI0029C87348|nr:hypothetical protein [Marispirochaeta aestuarii]